MGFLGIGAGKIELTLNSVSFHPNDIVNGTALLSLNEEVKAGGVFVRFWAEKRAKNQNLSTGKTRTDVEILYEEVKPLDSERIYGKIDSGKSYSFSFKVPEGVMMNPTEGNGVINGVLNFARKMNNQSIEWKIQAKLDLPAAFDVSATKKISVVL